ncbi:MAG: beta-lactamase family protein [Bacteroidetes bacterium]|nr:beta-lactamase family protein [Bacteroidota bacterium]
MKGLKILLSIVLVVVVGMSFFLFPQKKHELKATSRKDSTNGTWPADKPAYVAKEQNPFVEASLKEFESFIKMAMANGQAPGAALAVVRDTSIIFLKGYGLRDTQQPDSVNTRTVFRLGSVSKSVTASLASILVNEKIIHWDDPVVKYIPEFKLKSASATQSLTLRHVLSHTIGLPYHAFTGMIEEHTPFDTLVHHLQDLDLIGKPGELYSYQNVGFSLIGKVMERATGKKLEDLFTEKLFLPLHMSDASASFEKIMVNGNVARPHFFMKPRSISSAYYSVVPAGGLNASIQDMALWLKAMMGSRPDVLPRDRVNELFEPQVRAVARNLNFWQWKRVRKSFYALGWRIITFNDDTVAYHGGYVNNYRCEVAIDQKRKIGIALLVNSPGMVADQGIPHFLKIYDRYLDSINQWKPRRPL